MKATIIGAGLAGLLAANMFRRSDVAVLEAQSSLPNNHHAVLRFRTDKVAAQTGIPFRRVHVLKAVHASVNPVADALAYAVKVTGQAKLRSVINTAPSDRFIAPPDLIERMAKGVPIRFGKVVDADYISELVTAGQGVISTMPMPMLMDVLGYEGPRPAFRHKAGTVIKAEVTGADVFASIYYPHRLPCYRASITGSALAIETTKAPTHWSSMNAIGHLVHDVLDTFGLPSESVDANSISIHQQPYAKIDALTPEEARMAKDFMFWATTQRGVYSLGRFATWRPGLLMDDVVNDVLKIEVWMRDGFYNLRKDT